MKYIYELIKINYNDILLDKLNKKTCVKAAKNGQLKCLEFAFEKKFLWDEDTCFYATKHGHFECLKFAYENGCPWNRKICLNIIRDNKKDNFQLIFNYIKNKKYKDEIYDSNKKILNECIICCKNEKCVAFVPCGHMLSCWSCSIQINKCSSCHRKIDKRLKIFYE
jgi:hypothetical protein